MEMKHRLRRLSSNNLLILLIALIFLLLGVPLMGNARVMWRAGLTLVIVIAAIATERTKMVLGLGLLAAAITAPMNWLTLTLTNHHLFLISCIFEATFFATMASLILIAVVSKHLATVHSIYGAICSYLMFGLSWAMIYLGLCISPAGDWTITGLGFDVDEPGGEVAAFSQIIYFSFVTMSTLGYGDMTPETVLIRTLSWMQSVFGQFYIAVLVAWLVSEIPRRRFHDGLERRLRELERAPAESSRHSEVQPETKAGPPERPT